MVRGWTSSSDGRHHGAHYAEAAQALGTGSDAFLDFSQNINPLGPPRVALAAAERALHEEAGRYPDLEYAELRAALAGYLEVPPGVVLPTNGGAEALFLAARVVRPRPETAATESAVKRAGSRLARSSNLAEAHPRSPYGGCG